MYVKKTKKRIQIYFMIKFLLLKNKNIKNINKLIIPIGLTKKLSIEKMNARLLLR